MSRRQRSRGFHRVVVLALLAAAGCERQPTKDAPTAPPVAPVTAAAEAAWTPAWSQTRGGGGLSGRVPGPAPRQATLAWSFANGTAITSEASIAEGVIVFGDTDGSIHALDTATRQRRWQVTTEDTVEATALIADGLVFAGSNDGTFRALDLKDGRQVWSLEGDGKFPTGAVLAKGPDGRDVVLVNGYDGVTRCLRPADGGVVWHHETSDYINGSPALLDDDRMIFGGCDAQLHVLSLKDGSGSGTLKSEAQIVRSLAVWNGTVYGVNYADQLFAARGDADKPQWIYEPGTQFLSSPAVDDAHVFAGCRDKCLHAIDRETGKLLWKFTTGGRVAGSPLVFDDAVVFGSSDGRLYAVDKQDGKELWRLDLGEDLSLPPAAAGGRIVIGGGEGTLFVVSAGTPP